MTETKKVYDFIVVGSGIGGLVSAALLSMEGHSVLVLEKNHQIGGSLQVFSRDKCVFDTGVHYIGSLDEGENLHQIFKYLGIIDELNMKRLDDDGFDRINFADGKEYKHAQGYDNFQKQLIAEFPKEEQAIVEFCNKVKEICDYFPLYNLEDEDNTVNYVNNPEVLSINAWDYVGGLTNNKRLRAVLLGNGVLYAGDRETTPLYVVSLILNSYLKGSYRMLNGGSQIARQLTKKIHALGGKVMKHQDVCEARYIDGSVSSVITKSGEEHFAKNFISNVHPKGTVDMFGKEHFRAAYRNRLNKIQNTVSSFMLYLSFKEESFEYFNYNRYIYKVDEVWDTVDYKEDMWPETMYVCTPASRNQGRWAESMAVMAYMNYDEVKEWGDSFNTIAESGERGAAYEQFKRDKEQVILKELEKTYPNIRESIKGIYSSTPLTYKDYIGTDDGSLYGILKDSNNIMVSKINARTRVPNLFLTGQNIVFHGILGATIGSLVTCFNFIDSKELISKINKA
ncbi:MAG: phytoene desaturase family protein [Crocinitomicaceae bacterium]